MRVLLAPHGTRGDVQPMLALAIALRARGHIATFAIPSNSVDWVRSFGFDAESNGVDMEAMMHLPSARLESRQWQFARLKEHAARMFDPIARASDGVDVVVGGGAQLVTSSVAEWRDVPHVNVAFCPCALPSGLAPPPIVRTQTLPAWVNRTLWQTGVVIADIGLRGVVNGGRRSLGLAPIDSPLRDLTTQHVIVAADRDLAPLPDDVPPNVIGTDAWILESHETEGSPSDPRLEAFLRGEPSPIYAGFGSMASTRARTLAGHVVDAARAVGRRLIIAGGWAHIDRFSAIDDDDVLALATLTHRSVLPFVAVAVHHGGAGTTTAAAGAGVPQVLVPHVLDQFYWARRVRQLGLGPAPLPVELVTADVLTARLDAALNDPRIRQRAQAMGAAIASRNGVDPAIDHLERLVAPGRASA